MNNIAIAKETIRIMKEKGYEIHGKKVSLHDQNFENVRVISPEDGKNLLEQDVSYPKDEMCRFTVRNADSFQAARELKEPLVMNFANAHCPGGGFLLGATAQEEALCRCSTLYASISSKEASEMYRYNNTHLNQVESDYMLISPNVIVFRDEKGQLMEETCEVAVVTIAAPNRHGAAILASDKLIGETMLRRLRIMLRAAAQGGYHNLILGAWGCGVFGNDPKDVARYFEQVLVREELGRFFEQVCFAIYGKEDGKNITAFREVFQ